MNGPIDFGAINRAALAAFPAVLARILPGGKRVGAEIVALNPRGADRRLGSFKVNRYNGRGGHRSGSVETYSPHQRDRQTTNELPLIGAGPNRRADRPMPIGGA